MEENTFEKVVEDNRKMIYSIINSVASIGFKTDYSVFEDDLFQEGCIALYNAFNSFKPDGSAKFSTYAYMLIRRRIIHKFREFYRPIMYESCSYDSVREIDYLSYFKTPDMHDDETENYSHAVTFLNTLNDIDKAIVTMRKRKMSYKDISKVINLTPKQIDNRLCRIRRHYRAYLKEKTEQTS